MRRPGGRAGRNQTEATATTAKPWLSPMVERLLSLALAQAMGAWQTESIIAERAKRGSREKFLAVLAKAPDAPPVAGDERPAP